MSSKKVRLGLFSSITISSQEEFDQLKRAFDQAVANNQKTLKFGRKKIPVKRVAKFFNRYPQFQPISKNLQNQDGDQSKSTKDSVVRPEPPEAKTTPSPSQVQKFSKANREIIEFHNQKIQLSTAAANAASIVLKGRASEDLITFLRGSVYNYLSTNPKASPADAVRWAISLARSHTAGFNLESSQISQGITQKINAESWEKNQEVIKKTLGSSGPIFIHSNQPNSIENQISSLIQAENANLPEGKVKEISSQIKKAVDAVASSSNPANVSKQEVVKAVKQILIENNYHVANSQVDFVHDDLIHLAYTNAHQDVVDVVGNRNAPTSNLNLQTKSGNLSFNNSRVIFSITTQSEKTGPAPAQADTILQNLISRYYHAQSQQSPTNPSSIFTRFRSTLFRQPPQVFQPNYYVLAQQIPQYQTYLINQPSLSPSFFQNANQLFKMFSGGSTPGLGGLNLGNLGNVGKLGNSLSQGFSGLKNLFGFGRGAGGLAKGLQAGKAVSGLVGSLSLASIPAWIIPASLAVVGVFIFFYFNRFQLDTVAEVRSNYGSGGGLIEEQSKYASLNKEASVTKLEDPTGSITYTYTITPLLGPITITSFTDTTTIFQESGERTLTLDTPPEEPPAEISTTFTSNQFSLTLDSSMDDAMISNTIEITFINPAGQTETISSAAVTIIGNPPFCPPTLAPIDGASRSGWPYVCAESTCLNPPNGHCGVDLSGSLPIKSPFNCQAVVSRVQTSGSESFGHYVVLNSGPYYAFFAHMDGGSITVSAGDFVAPGQVLGMMDNTGNSSGNHLHYEVRNSELGSINVGSNCQPPVSINPCEIPGSQISGLCN